MSVATGKSADISDATRKMVRFGPVTNPDPKLVDLYDRMMPIYSDLYQSSQAFYDRLDAL